MYPILFSVGPIAVSSFGIFLALSLIAAMFSGWRLGKVYDIHEEKILDLVILTFAGGMVGARLLFVIFNLGMFNTLEKVILVTRYPGLSFWGGLLGGCLVLFFLSRRFKLNFWQAADFAAASLALGIVLGDLGCFFGGCAYGAVSNLPIATPIVGLLGKRLPISLIEAITLLLAFNYLWKQTIRFHFNGKIVSSFLMILGVVKFVTEFYRGDSRFVPFAGWLTFGHLFSLVLLILGLAIFYNRSKRNLVSDILDWVSLLYSSKKRKNTLLTLKKTWYNHQISLKIKMSKTGVTLKTAPRVLKRRLNVKSTPTNLS
jgi:phosphatidylglycerol:prolipoprotein diacylglycerol transferase